MKRLIRAPDLTKNKGQENTAEKQKIINDIAGVFNDLLSHSEKLEALENKVKDSPALEQKAISQIASIRADVASLYDRLTGLTEELGALSARMDSATSGELYEKLTELRIELADRLGATASIAQLESLRSDMLSAKSQWPAEFSRAVAARHERNKDTGLGAQQQNLDMGGHRIENAGDPRNAGDVATKRYADSRQVFISGGGGNVGAQMRNAEAKTTPVDADTQSLIDSADGNALKKVTWANIKATLKSYFDGFYGAGGGDMTKAVYDPNTVEADAFDVDNHVDGATNKVYTATEKTKLAGIEALADVTDATNVATAGALMAGGTDNVKDTHIDWGAAASQVDADDVPESATKKWAGETGADVTANNAPQAHAASHLVSGADTIFPADPGADKYLMWDDDPGALVWSSPAGGGDMTAAVYDPQSIVADAFNTDNHTDGITNGVYTLTERTRLAGIEDSADVTDATNVSAAGALMVADLENPPAEDEASKAPTSEWAFDHDADVSAHHVKYTDAEAVSAVEAAGLTFAENKGVILDSALSADGKWSGDTFPGVAGATIAFGDVVYLASTGKWLKAKGDAEATVSPMVAVVIVGGNDTEAIVLMTKGFIREDDWNWATIGLPVFISAATAGVMTQTELTTGQFQKMVGHAWSADEIAVNVSPDWVKVG